MDRNRRLALLAVIVGGLFAGSATAAAGRYETAVFAGGCFWTMEHGLEDVPGVVSAVSGFAGGRVSHPTYDQVNTERTGHMESVKVTYDPAKITYTQLLDRYWHMIDPTDSGGQACDRGASYRSAVFVSTPEQRKIAEASRAQLQIRFKGKVATQIRDAQPFWPAEAYHQQYARKNPADYAAYRFGCGRDQVLKRIWGSVPNW